MARPWRIQYPGAIYHVTSRGNNRQDIFLDNEDRRYFLDLIPRASSRFNLRIFAFCLMTNHYHIFLQTPDANLAPAMHWLNTAYTVNFNRANKKSGHLFQGRYKSVLITDESHWLRLSMYIHLNPVRAGIFNDPAQYKWSSFRDYTRTTSRFPWLHEKHILKNYGPKGAASKKEYRKTCIALAKKPPSFWQGIRSSVVLGSKETLEKLIEKYGPKGKTEDITGFSSHRISAMDIDKELSRVASFFNARPKELTERRRNFLPRQAAYYHLVENRSFPVTKVSDIMGITQPAVSYGIAKLKREIGKDKNLRKMLEGLHEA
jgi:putative transposase